MYWLGERFEAGGLTFEAIGGEFHRQDAPRTVEIFYSAAWEGGGSVAFRLASSDSYTYKEAIHNQVAKPLKMTRRDTTIGAWPAASFGVAAGRWTNQSVIVGAPGSVVVVAANASIVNGRQVNPLNDPDVLLSVLDEKLRPYPE